MYMKLQDSVFPLLINYKDIDASLMKLYGRNIFYQSAHINYATSRETNDSLKTIPMLLLQFIVCLWN